MPAQTSMLHVRVDDHLKAKAADALAGVGLTLSDAVRILLTRVAAEGGMPAGLTADPEAYDADVEDKRAGEDAPRSCCCRRSGGYARCLRVPARRGASAPPSDRGRGGGGGGAG